MRRPGKRDRDRGPRKIGLAVRAAGEQVAPKTPLARIQSEWASVTGREVARECVPTAEKEGVITVVCSSSVWASELDLRQSEVVERLREKGVEGIRSLRCRTGSVD